MLLHSMHCEKEYLWLQLTNLTLLDRINGMDDVVFQQSFNLISILKTPCVVSFFSIYIPSLLIETFAFLNQQACKMQIEHWILIEKSFYKLCFAGSLGGEKHSFLKRYYKQLMPEKLKSFPSFRVIYMIYAAFHLCRLQQEENTGIHDVMYFHF